MILSKTLARTGKQETLSYTSSFFAPRYKGLENNNVK